MEDIKNYITRQTEVLDSIGRFARIYAPELRCDNGSFVECEQDGKKEIARVMRQVGKQRFDLDLLGARVEKGVLKVALLEHVFSVKIETTSMQKLRWTQCRPDDEIAFPIKAPIILDSAPIDHIAPITRGATHVVFYNESHPIRPLKLVDKITKFFTHPVVYTTSDEVLNESKAVFSLKSPQNENALDVFAMFTKQADLAWIDCQYAPELSKHLVEFEKDRNPTTTVVAFVKTSEEIFPIIESLNFGDIEAIWVIDETFRLDPTRTRTRISDGDLRRAEIMGAIHQYKEEKFEADLLGEPFEKEIPYPEIWEPIF